MNCCKKPLFSVIVPVYKVEKYLCQCVDSILQQTFSDFEVILVDDGSPDQCGIICDEYARKDSRVKVIHKENSGVVNARREAYDISEGLYITHVDGDDYISADLLKLAAEKIQSYGVDAVLFGYIHFDEHSEEYYPQKVASGLYGGDQMAEIRDNLIVGADGGTSIHNALWALAIRKDRLAPYIAVPSKTISRGEDLAVTAPALAQCNAVYVLEECPYFYRKTPGSIMNSHRGNELDQALILTTYLWEMMGKEYGQKLDVYFLRELYEHLICYRESWSEYRREASKARNYMFHSGLQCKLYGKKTKLLDRIVFFLLRCRMFNLLWLVWWIRRNIL